MRREIYFRSTGALEHPVYLCNDHKSVVECDNSSRGYFRVELIPIFLGDIVFR